MSADVIALIGSVAVNAALTFAFIALVWRHISHVEGRAREQEVQASAMRHVANERDDARKDLAARALELTHLEERNDELELSLATERRSTRNARIATVVDSEPGDVGAVVDRMLAEEIADRAERTAAADSRDTKADTVRGPGSPSDGPTPSWAGVDKR